MTEDLELADREPAAYDHAMDRVARRALDIELDSAVRARRNRAAKPSLPEIAERAAATFGAPITLLRDPSHGAGVSRSR